MSWIEDERSNDFSTDEENYSRPFRVRVIEDIRDQEEITLTGRQDGQSGWCLGMYEFPDRAKKRPEGETRDLVEGQETFYNPLIYTDSGTHLWGIQCFFMKDTGWMKNVPLDVAQQAVELEKQRLRTELGIDIQISLN